MIPLFFIVRIFLLSLSLSPCASSALLIWLLRDSPLILRSTSSELLRCCWLKKRKRENSENERRKLTAKRLERCENFITLARFSKIFTSFWAVFSRSHWNLFAKHNTFHLWFTKSVHSSPANYTSLISNLSRICVWQLHKGLNRSPVVCKGKRHTAKIRWHTAKPNYTADIETRERRANWFVVVVSISSAALTYRSVCCCCCCCLCKDTTSGIVSLWYIFL